MKNHPLLLMCLLQVIGFKFAYSQVTPTDHYIQYSAHERDSLYQPILSQVANKNNITPTRTDLSVSLTSNPTASASLSIVESYLKKNKTVSAAGNTTSDTIGSISFVANGSLGSSNSSINIFDLGNFTPNITGGFTLNFMWTKKFLIKGTEEKILNQAATNIYQQRLSSVEKAVPGATQVTRDYTYLTDAEREDALRAIRVTRAQRISQRNPDPAQKPRDEGNDSSSDIKSIIYHRLSIQNNYTNNAYNILADSLHFNTKTPFNSSTKSGYNLNISYNLYWTPDYQKHSNFNILLSFSYQFYYNASNYDSLKDVSVSQIQNIVDSAGKGYQLSSSSLTKGKEGQLLFYTTHFLVAEFHFIGAVPKENMTIDSSLSPELVVIQNKVTWNFKATCNFSININSAKSSINIAPYLQLNDLSNSFVNAVNLKSRLIPGILFGIPITSKSTVPKVY